MELDEELEFAMMEIVDDWSYDYNRHNNKFSKIYPFTTENIHGYLRNLKLNDKKVLTVGSSADQILNCICKDCTDITCFDYNPFVKYYFALKKAAIKSLSYNDFLQYFLYEDYPEIYQNNGDSFSFKIYQKISQYLDSKSRLFWDYLYLECSGLTMRKRLFSSDTDNISILSVANMYLKENKYYQLKKKIDKANVEFINCDLKEVSEHLTKKYDYVFLSNIACYADKMYDKNPIMEYRDTIMKLNNNLTENGKIYLAYLYDTKKNTKYEKNWPSIYDLKRTFKIFSKEDLEMESFLGIKGIINANLEINDSVLIYKKKKQLIN